MSIAHGFPPISRPDAQVLILGSMPSRESLAQRQYYAHARNAFWPILTLLLGIEEKTYSGRCACLQAAGIAVWDVLRACFREGSLDSAIDDSTIVTNDFPAFFDAHPGIRRVYFNGAKADSVYRRRVLPSLNGPAAELSLRRLPSTSPAHAGMSLEQKTEAWRVLLDEGLNRPESSG